MKSEEEIRDRIEELNIWLYTRKFVKIERIIAIRQQISVLKWVLEK